MESEGPSRRHQGVMLFQVLHESERPSVNAISETGGIPRHPAAALASAFSQDYCASMSTHRYESANPLDVSQNDRSSTSLSVCMVAAEPRNAPNREMRAQISTQSGSVASQRNRHATLSVRAEEGSSAANSSASLTEQGICVDRDQSQIAEATSRAATGAHAQVGAEQYRAPPWSPLNQLRALPLPSQKRNNVE
jgi:hypothetical protein